MPPIELNSLGPHESRLRMQTIVRLRWFGVLGQLASGDTVPEFEAALCEMADGSICDAPVESRYGFHLIRLDARVRGEVLPFAAVLPHLRQAQEKADWVRGSRAYVEALAARAEITGIDLSETLTAEVRQSA